MGRKEDRAKATEKKVYISETILKENVQQLERRLQDPKIRKQERRLTKRAIARLTKVADEAAGA